MRIFTLLGMTLLAVNTALADGQRETISLASGEVARNLRLSVLRPAGWSAEWYKEGTSIVRLFKDGTGGSVALVIAASPIPSQFEGKTENDIFSSKFLDEGSRQLCATSSRRVTNEQWNGAYFEYPLPGYSGPDRINVKNWMMVADGYIVQFQCYYYFRSSDSTEIQKANEERVEDAYREILRSVREPSNQ